MDGSSYLYRAFHALPPLTTSKGLPTGAVKGVLNMLKKSAQAMPGQSVRRGVRRQGRDLPRRNVAEYKANRSSMPDDMRVQDRAAAPKA